LKKIYSLIRGLHLYFGLFISPFILVFSISVLVFNNGGFLNKFLPVEKLSEVRTGLDNIPYDTTDLGTAKAIIGKLGIEGEIDFIAKNSGTISFPVNKPGLKTRVELDTNTKIVTITRQKEGLLRGLSYLHIMPGQHNAKIRGNSVFIKIWRKMADAVVYLLIFLTTSGIFLWYFTGSERESGVFALIFGGIIFTSLLYLIL
jgi:hypothetical protein